MVIKKYTPGKIPEDVHKDVCSFLYSNKNDLDLHLRYAKGATFFVAFSDTGKIIGTVNCVWKQGSILPLEEAYLDNERVIVNTFPAVYIGGLKVDDSVLLVDRMKCLDQLFKMVQEETVGYYLYLVCSENLEKLYQRKFNFATLGRVTFDNQEYFTAMMIKNRGQALND